MLAWRKAAEFEKSCCGSGVRPARPIRRISLALGVKLGNLRESRRVLKDQRVIVTALRQRYGACARRPANLALDLSHELLDTLGGIIRLFHLRVQQLGFAVAIGEPHFGGAAERQDGNDQSDEGDDIFAEEASSAEPPKTRRQFHSFTRSPDARELARMQL